jgi:putative SOS response-associated peptidase YedK
MCGRYVSVSSPTILAERFEVEQVRVEATEANYNVAPRADVPVVAQSRGTRVLDVVRWGLVPFWAKDMSIGDRCINARAERIQTANAYKRAFEKRRCIVPADGFYEWQKLDNNKKKQPWFFRRRDGEPLAFAGLWELWNDVRTCTIITTEANDVVRPVHERMPVVLPESTWAEWLDEQNRDVVSLQRLLVPADASAFEAWPVSTLVNKADNNSPELLDRTEVVSA